jgi:hypothetical protein
MLMAIAIPIPMANVFAKSLSVDMAIAFAIGEFTDFQERGEGFSRGGNKH